MPGITRHIYFWLVNVISVSLSFVKGYPVSNFNSAPLSILLGLELETEVETVQPIFPNLTWSKLLFKNSVQKKNCIRKINFLTQVLHYFWDIPEWFTVLEEIGLKISVYLISSFPLYLFFIRSFALHVYKCISEVWLSSHNWQNIFFATQSGGKTDSQGKQYEILKIPFLFWNYMKHLCGFLIERSHMRTLSWS